MLIQSTLSSVLARTSQKTQGQFFFNPEILHQKNVLPVGIAFFHFTRDRRTGRHDDASSHFSRLIWRCDWKSVEFLQIAARFIKTRRTFTVSDNSLCSARRLELQTNSSLRSARKPLATTWAVNSFNTNVLKFTGSPSPGDPCVEDIDCSIYFGNHAECIIGISGAGECGCKVGAHFKEDRCYETASK